MTLNQRHQHILGWLKEAKNLIQSYSRLDIQEKADHRDLVTQVDLAIQSFFLEKIEDTYPNEQIIGEESWQGQEVNLDGPLWLIDPIDGTSNFIKQKKDFGILLAYFDGGQGQLSYVYLPEADDLFYSQRGQGVYYNDKALEKPKDLSLSESMLSIEARKLYKTPLLDKIVAESFDIRAYGSSTVDGSRVIAGQLGGFINGSAGPWDFAPYILMSEELGLHISDFHGNPLRLDRESPYVLTTPQVYKDLAKELDQFS